MGFCPDIFYDFCSSLIRLLKCFRESICSSGKFYKVENIVVCSYQVATLKESPLEMANDSLHGYFLCLLLMDERMKESLTWLKDDML